MTPREAQALIDRALETQTLGVCIIALQAVKKLELCPVGTTAKLEALTQMEPVNPDEGFEGKYMESKYQGFCSDCGVPYEEGELVFWQGRGRGVLCRGCRIAETDPKVKKRKS